MSEFVDFKALRKSLSFEKVLKHYGIDVKIQRGNRHVGFNLHSKCSAAA